MKKSETSPNSSPDGSDGVRSGEHLAFTADAAERVRSIWSLKGKYKILHATWFAFFLTFVVWFNFAPFATTIQDQFGFSKEQIITLGLVNVALTVPARVFVGMALDHWGPRRVYSAILIFSGIPCMAFALANTYSMFLVSRLALSVVGAGFVVGIRMISEWFPPKEVGTAEGLYGGWGNFGAAGAAFCLPLVAGMIVGGDGWRWAIGGSGVVAMIYGVLYLKLVSDTPDGVTFVRPKRNGALEVTTRGAVVALIALLVPLSAVLLLIIWRIWKVGVLSGAGVAIAGAAVVVLLYVQTRQAIKVNAPALAGEVPKEDRYPFSSVVVLALAYFCSFGGELAIVTMLPAFFEDTWGLSTAEAGIAASAFAFTNLVARPAGGLFSDMLGSRKRTLTMLLGFTTAGSVLLASMGQAWPWVLAAVACMFCSLFVQGTNGAVYAVVPLVKKRVSGQISGLVGAYGNVGALVFITASLYVSSTIFFLIIGASALIATVASRKLIEPANSFAAELATDSLVEELASELETLTDTPPAESLAPRSEPAI